MLPEETVVAEPFEVDAFGLDGAVFSAERDPETNFKLFGPVASALTDAKTASRAFALRLRPNQDFAGALEMFCRHHGILHARLHGGVGSTIGACFTDGRTVVPFATELAIRSGSVAPGGNGTLHADLDIALVDYLGGIAEGTLMRGDNPVLMTMELVLEVLGEEAR
jgi:predicted DNA-binding protein with PD1-like motif